MEKSKAKNEAKHAPEEKRREEKRKERKGKERKKKENERKKLRSYHK